MSKNERSFWEGRAMPDRAASATPWPRIVAVVVVLAVAVGVVVLAFLWPTATASPRELPVGIVASAPQTAAIESALDEGAPGVIAVQDVADRAAAVAAIERRELVGAIVLDPAPEVLVASAASPAVAQLLGGLAPALGAQLAAAAAAAGIDLDGPVSVAVTDVVPLAAGDERGAIIAAASFPIVLGGILGGVAVGLLVRGTMRRLTALVAYAVVGASAVAAVLVGVFGALPGPIVAITAAIALALLAIAGLVAGLAAVLGRPGIPLGAILVLLVANPLSAAAVPVEFLVAPWGAIGQWLPPGAGATLLRDVAYFPAADASFPWLVLAGWAAVGLILVALGRMRDVRRPADAGAAPAS